MKSKFDNVLEMIGNTPVLKINNIDTGKCDLYVKMESLNPFGSIKDRVGLKMIEDAESQGLLKEGSTIIESTAGNTGLGLALAAKLKGYKLILVIPDKMSEEKIMHLEAMGVEIIMTRSDVENGHPEHYQSIAENLLKTTPNSFFANQFENESNPKVHFETTGPEIWEQMEGNIDAFVAGVGTGGTISGVGAFLKSKNSDIKVVVADPVGSVVADAVNTGEYQYDGGSWSVEGIGEDYIPKNLNLDVIDEGIYVSDVEAFKTIDLLLQKEGILAGSSCGTLVNAAVKWCREQAEAKTVVTLICDTGNKYLSKAFNKEWIKKNIS
ncbi:MAG: cystathionine beta-lyase [Gammaproteobacteria bacterium TMED222]|nr:MAG: cystathionine beta-lyase [Gammaproteobacteria bacterium TMED222]